MLSAFHGLCMALADSVPGVSGGTIAFILGFYDDLLRALQGLFNGKGPVRRQSLRALLRFGIGWGVGMAACILALAELFELHVYFMCSLFLGLSAAAFPLVARAERGALRNTARYAPLALLGAALVVGLTLLREDAAVSLRVDFSELRVWPLLYLFVSGAIAVSAMILPGISGSTLLLIAGVYLPAMHALRQLLRLDFSGLPGILALGLGAAAGAALAARAIRAALRRATIGNKIVPVTCGSSYKNKGVQELLDAIVEYMPSPLDKKAVTGINPKTEEDETREPSDDAPFAALAFKIMTDPYVGKLAFFRVYSGCLEAGKTVLNTNKNQRERMGRILLMHANHREDLPVVYSGDIAAAVGLKNTTTGDTLCDEKHPIVLENMVFPEPVIRVAIEPKTKAGQEKMGIALSKLAEEDPTFKTYTDEETGQTIIAGMGELHLEIIVDRLLREFKVEANVGAPQVAYKETIRKKVNQETKYARQSGGKGQYGHVKITVEPNESGKGFEFINATVGGSIPKEFIPAVEQGIRGAMEAGVLAGFPVVDVKVTLYDGSYHEVDSSELAFKIAGSMAFKEACQKADPVILEPIMKVCIIVPDEYMGDVIGDVTSRRGNIAGLTQRNGAQQIDCFVPLSEMFGYATNLRSRTQGRGQFTMEPSHYVELSKNLADAVISKRRGV